MINRRTIINGASVVTAVLVAFASARLARAADEPQKRLVYSLYKNESAAMEVFRTLRMAEDQGAIKIDSYAVLSKDLTGKVKVRDQRQKGTRAGAVVGAIVGLLGGPIGVAVGATAGGAAGYLTGNAIGMSKDTVEQVKSSLQPGESAVVVAVEERWAPAVEKLQETNASRMMTHEIPPIGAPPTSTAPVAPAPAPPTGTTPAVPGPYVMPSQERPPRAPRPETETAPRPGPETPPIYQR